MKQEEIDGQIEVLDREIGEVKAEIEYERESHREALRTSEWFAEIHAETLGDLERKLAAKLKRREDPEMAIPEVDVEPPPDRVALFVVSSR